MSERDNWRMWKQSNGGGRPAVSFFAGGSRVWHAAALWLAIATSVVANEGVPDFNRDIRPILSDKCFQCHGPDAEHREADLRLDVEEAAKADLGGYRAIHPDEPASSEVLARITAEDSSMRMPPADSGKSLSPEEVELLRRWMEAGAPWSAAWAYVPPRQHPVPRVSATEWPRNWIDQFLLASLEARQLAPAADADAVTLVRRLYWDLTGLPPTSEQVQAFVKDSDPAAYARLVDRLLASPAYGERMAAYWLDLVRFADTVGYHGDQDHNVSPYRDYVIDAFNLNLPFDQFTVEQLAGDLLESDSIDPLIASAYNRLLQTSHEGGVQPKEYLAIYGADRVRNVSEVWMAGTLGCAQCHDHKYDPYTSKDFYAMKAFFADLDEAQHFSRGTNNLPTARPPEQPVLTRQERLVLASWREEQQQLEAELERLRAEQAAGAEAVPSAEEPAENSPSAADPLLAGREQRLKEIVDHCRRLEENARTVMISRAIEPRTTRILPRGNWLDDSGPEVLPAVPEFLGRVPPSERATRLDLARWLTDPDEGAGGLTARVMVNRFWYLCFGAGLARDLADFGGQGEPPDHPELLDNLALEFVRSGWDVKHLMRLMVTSRAYRQSSQAAREVRSQDPENRWLGRQSRHRIPAEMVRDQALQLGGLLVAELGGRSVKPYQPAGYYRHLNFPPREYESDESPQQWRRAVYVHWQRQFLHPMLRAFDAPSREECTARRARSNTPLAALVLLNDPTFVEAARAFAARVLAEAAKESADAASRDRDRLRWAWRQALLREPDAWECETLETLLNDARDYYRDHPEEAEKLLQVGIRETHADWPRDEWAAWTSVTRAILNLGDVVTRR